MMRLVGGTDFYVPSGDFSGLEIRPKGDGSDFHYFFDTASNRLITDFVLKRGPKVDTLCRVTLIKKDNKYSPRFRFWKRDTTEPSRRALQAVIYDGETTKTVRASVDTSDAYKELWEVIHFLQSFAEVSIPDNNFRVVTRDSARLAQSLQRQEKKTVLEAVQLAFAGTLTEDDVRLLSNRKAQLEMFDRLLKDDAYFEQERTRLRTKRSEDVWQAFFESNPWIFGYGLKLIACRPFDDGKLERITSGANIFTGAGKRIDAVMRSRGFVSSLLFCEIKTHTTPLLYGEPYRKPDVYHVSTEVSGGLSQVQKTVSKALDAISRQLYSHYEDDGTPANVHIVTAKPRQALVVGNLSQFRESGGVNREKVSSFELYRNSIEGVEIITFDELYERARFIVRDD
jgi:hypothetical protein